MGSNSGVYTDNVRNLSGTDPEAVMFMETMYRE